MRLQIYWIYQNARRNALKQMDWEQFWMIRIMYLLIIFRVYRVKSITVPPETAEDVYGLIKIRCL